MKESKPVVFSSHNDVHFVKHTFLKYNFAYLIKIAIKALVLQQIINAKSSTYRWLNDLNDIPFVGAFIILGISALPAVIIYGFAELIQPLSKVEFQLVSAFVYPIWNFFLARKDIHIRLFFLPAWMLWSVFSIGFLFEMISGS